MHLLHEMRRMSYERRHASGSWKEALFSFHEAVLLKSLFSSTKNHQSKEKPHGSKYFRLNCYCTFYYYSNFFSFNSLCKNWRRKSWVSLVLKFYSYLFSKYFFSQKTIWRKQIGFFCVSAQAVKFFIAESFLCLIK